MSNSICRRVWSTHHGNKDFTEMHVRKRTLFLSRANSRRFEQCYGLRCVKGKTAEYKTDFESWQEATGRFRSNREDLNWIFRGAREALDRSKSTMGESRSTLLVKMMDALDDSSVTLPAMPEPECSSILSRCSRFTCQL